MSSSRPTPGSPASPAVRGRELVCTLTAPTSIAIVGASADPNSYGGRPVRYLSRYGYEGETYLVNPNRDNIDGQPCLRSPADLPDGLDLAMVALPGSLAVDAVDHLASIGTKAVVTIAGDMTSDGKARLRDIARSSSTRIVGPNCIGVIGNHASSFVSFSAQLQQDRPKLGSIGLVTQSGAMGNSLLLSLRRRSAGLASWITTGDESDVGGLEVIAGLLDDPDVRGVGAFFEGMGDIEWLGAVAEAISRTDKPVYVVKGARTSAGKLAAAGHTGRVVGAALPGLEVMRSAGLSVLPDMAALADVLITLDISRRPRGKRLAVVTISGGVGVLAADAIHESTSLQLADINAADPALVSRIGGRVYDITNPLDTAGSSAEIFADWVNAIADCGDADAVVGVAAPMIHDVDALVGELRAPADGAVVALANFSEADPLPADALAELALKGIPVLASAERAVAALDALVTRPQWKVPSSDATAEADDDSTIGIEEVMTMVGERLPWAPMGAANTTDAARSLAEKMGWPVVVKLAGRLIQHRSDIGGVEANVTADNIVEAWTRIADLAARTGDAVIVQAQAPPGAEILVSGLRDMELGPVVIVRPGGVLTELVHDQAICWHGWGREKLLDQLTESIIGRLLLGYRGGRHYDLEAVADLVQQVLGLLDDELDFIELNPVIVGESGVVLVDALGRRAAVAQH